LFVDNGQPLHKDDEWSWEKFAQKIPDRSSNAMLVVDNYILRNGEQDLYDMLIQLLPDECAIGYHLTIFYYMEGPVTENMILDLIKERKPNLIDNLQLELIRVAGIQDFHDRAVITNNYWIGVGGGFDISFWDRASRMRRVKRSTNAEVVYPYFASSNVNRIDKAYENLLEEAIQELPLARSSSRNRLLQR
jgi:hypothetical protein